ncbi:MAG TPA: phosphodiester glycosidase family protein [Phycisphaerae bacterium]|nr:phosphodiester glycosidase family protein [Phycisphaerae bacterium]
MKPRLILAIILVTWPTGLAHAQWTDVAPGISYTQMNLPGPVKVFIARADRGKDNWTIDAMTSKGTIKGGIETVPDMAKRYDDTVTFDGRRYEVKAAINGSFYGVTGYSFGGQVMTGWYAKRYDDISGLSGFFWTADRKADIGGDVQNGPNFQQVIFADKDEMNINAFNDKRGKDDLALYTAQYDATTGTDNNGVEVLVRVDEPLCINPKPPGVRGEILSIRKNAGSTTIPFDCVVLSAAGAAAPRLLQHAKKGQPVHLNLRLQDIGIDRYGMKPARWENVWGSINGTQNLLFDGIIPKHWEAKAARYAAEGKPHGSTKHDPRTCVAFNKDYVFFIVIDGRSEESIGMTYTETAEFCKNTLKADHASMQDGGGSTTLWVDGKVRNTPSTKDKDGKYGVLRPVANGYLIARVHPPEFSKDNNTGDRVSAETAFELKLGPGSQYGPAGKVIAGAKGEILKHKLAGVFAKGTNWWPCRFGQTEGWAAQERLKTAP